MGAIDRSAVREPRSFKSTRFIGGSEPNSLSKGSRFGLWGLSAWLTPGKFEIPSAVTFNRTMATPVFPDRDPKEALNVGARAQLFLVGWIFLLAAPLVMAADFDRQEDPRDDASGERRHHGPYVSAVKVYTEDIGGVPASEVVQSAAALCHPAANGAVIADAALAGYDRWYVLAHSQGTVVAVNGLMTSGRILSTFLDMSRLAQLLRHGFAGPWRYGGDGPTFAQAYRIPISGRQFRWH